MNAPKVWCEFHHRFHRSQTACPAQPRWLQLGTKQIRPKPYLRAVG